MVSKQVSGQEDVVASYTPADNPPGWRRVAGEVRKVVRTALPLMRYSAGELMGVLSQLALFADAEGQPIRADLWLTREYIERFVLVGCAHLGESSRANYRSKLLRLREAVLGGDCATGTPARLSSSPTSYPYTRAEQVSLWTWACGQPTDELRDNLAVLISLGLGCGLSSHEIIPLRAGDVSVGGSGARDQPTVVAVRGRRSRLVVCRRPWESTLTDLAARVDVRDAHLFRPGASRRGGNLVTNFLSRSHPVSGTPALKTSRLRATWLAELIEAGLPLTVIVAAAGLGALHGLSRLMPHIGRMEASQAARLLRDSP
ncbi:hypothetical protein [Actinomadura terrae]|uniref:hypothetical protein n=1 Tax=Actinomadura terrae TaxID=604353 RepID=UPI001FA7B7F7|nr:hypothetical protein [Actinomadura terrae]